MVPVTALVFPGEEPSGLGEPWLKACLFQVAAKADKSPASRPPSWWRAGILVALTLWRSVALVDAEKSTPKNRTGRITRDGQAVALAVEAGTRRRPGRFP